MAVSVANQKIRSPYDSNYAYLLKTSPDLLKAKDLKMAGRQRPGSVLNGVYLKCKCVKTKSNLMRQNMQLGGTKLITLEI